MYRLFRAFALSSCLLHAGAALAEHGVIERIAGPDGGYDYLAVDSGAKKLFVGREYGVMAVALDTGVVTERLIEANDVSAVLILPGTGLMLSTVYGEDKAVIFDRATGALKGTIKTGKSPDAAAYDPASGMVFVMNAKSNDASVVDTRAMKRLATIPMGGKPEAAVADGRGRMFVNIEDTAEIAVIDTATRKVAARYKMQGCVEPTGIALDAATGTLIAACHNSTAKLIDAATGADRGTVKIGADADGAIFDIARRRVYIPAKDGTLTVFRLDEYAKAHDVETVITQPGARTAALDATMGRVYLAAAQSTEGADGEEQRVPGTFNILVVANAPRSIVVCQAAASGCDFSGDNGIQAAIDHAADGDTVLLRAGRYHPRAYRDLDYKEIVVRAFVAIDGKRLTLRGEPGAVLDGSTGIPATGIGLRNADVTIRGLELTGFRWGVEEDDIYEGHGIFAVDSRARIDGVTISKYQKMGLTGRGNTILDVTDLKVLDGHVASWIYDGAYMRLDGAAFRNNDSSAVAVYDNGAAHLSHIAVDGSADDGLYAEGDASIYVSHSLIVGSKPIALNAKDRSRITAAHVALHGNAADTSATGVTMGEGIVRADPKVGADYRPLAGSPIAGLGIGPAR